MKKPILLSLLTALPHFFLWSQVTLYIAPDGNNEWSGKTTEATGTDGPMSTLSAAVEHARELKAQDSTVTNFRLILREGVYPVHQPIKISAQDDFELWIEAWPGEYPVISAGREIKGWKKGRVNGRSCWTVNIPEVKAGEWYFRQLFVNDRRASRPRIPDTGFYEVEDPLLGKSDKLGEQLSGGARDRFIYREGDIRDWKNLQDVNIMVLHYWQEDYLPIKEIHPDKREVVFKASSYMAFVRSHPAHSCGYAWYYADNVFEALDSPGEWYLDKHSGNLFYIPHKEENIKDARIYAPVVLQSIRVEGDPLNDMYAGNVHFSGITFKHNAVQWDAHYGTGNSFGNSGKAMISFYGTRDCSIEDCLFENMGEYAIEVYGCSSNIHIVGNEFSDLAAGAIKISSAADNHRGFLPVEKMTRSIFFSDNQVQSGGRVFHGAVAVLANYIHSSRFLHNHIADFYYNGIVCGGYRSRTGCYDNLIMKNHIHDIGQGWLSDMGGVYVHGLQPGMVISENLIHDIQSACYGSNAVYVDDRAQHIIVERNLLYRTNTNIINMKGMENMIRNNILAFGDLSLIRRASPHVSDSSVATVMRNVMLVNGTAVHRTRHEIPVLKPGYTSDVNMIWDVNGNTLRVEQPFHYKKPADIRSFEDWQKVTGNDLHSVIKDPLMADPLNGDFSLLPGSDIQASGIVLGEFGDVGPRPADKRHNPFRKKVPAITSGEGHVE